MGKMKNENFKRKNGWIDGSYRLLVHGHSLRFSCWWCGTVWGKNDFSWDNKTNSYV